MNDLLLMEDVHTGQQLHFQAYELFMQAPAAISVYKGVDHTVILANDFALQLAGKTREEIIGKPILSILPEIEAQGFVAILDSVFTTGEPYSAFEFPITLNINSQPQLLYLNLLYKPYRELDGTISGILGFATNVTEQVIAKKKVQETQQQFKYILSQAPDPILILKGEKLVLEVGNDPLLRLWNIDETAIGTPFLQLLPEMKEQGFYDLLLDVYKNGVTHYGYEAPVYFVRNDIKQLHYFNFVYHPYREADNSITGVLVMASEVTNQVIARKKAAEAEQEYMTLVMQAPIGICILKGLDFIVEIANDAYLELAGKQRNNFIHRKLWEVLPEAKDQGFDEILTRVLKTGKTFRGVDHPVLLVRNGLQETVYVDFVYEPIKNEEHDVNRIMVLAYDVTDKVLARQRIEEAEQNARLGIELADLGTYEIDIASDKIIASKRFNYIFGFEEDVSRKDYISTVHPEDLEIRDNAHKEAMQTGKLHYEARVIWKDNSVHWVRVRGNVIFDNNNVPYWIKGVVQDITDQKRFADELSRQVSERTKELHESNRKLLKSNAELEQFAYVTSHDLQEPLRKIQIFSGMVADQFAETPGAGKYLEKIANSARRMNDLIRNLLDYSRISNAATIFHKVDLKDILSAIMIDFELLIEQKKAEITIENLEVIEAVPLQMNQLFYNLIGNALKFTRKNVVPTVTVKGERLHSAYRPKFPELNMEEEYFKIEVRDNGIGFNQDYANQIFTIFQRLNDNSVYGGYGIGLAICKKIIDNHKGFIYAEGKEYEGACFIIVLPIKQT